VSPSEIGLITVVVLPAPGTCSGKILHPKPYATVADTAPTPEANEDVFESLTDDLIRKGLKLKAGAKPDEVGTEIKDDDDDPDPHPGNKGKLQLDETVCDADIKYPTDLDLLNESRQRAEELIDELCLKLGVQDKPRTYRRVHWGATGTETREKN
jgi:hypothetical protein